MRTCLDGSIEIEAPASEAYEHWTRIENFPRFIDAVESVQRIDEKRSLWRVNLGFRRLVDCPIYFVRFNGVVSGCAQHCFRFMGGVCMFLHVVR